MNIGNFLLHIIQKRRSNSNDFHSIIFSIFPFKVGHLALVEDDNIARVLSWQLIGDMDCLIVNNMRKVS